MTVLYWLHNADDFWLKGNSEDRDDVDDNEEDIMTMASLCSCKRPPTSALPLAPQPPTSGSKGDGAQL